jgi:beta-mannosidase
MKKTIESLGGAWRAVSVDGAYETTVSVPGSLMEALERDGVFGKEGLFHRENNRKAEGIAKRDFVFTKEIELRADFVQTDMNGQLFLEADGIDTLATIIVNGEELAKTANMHRRYRFPLRDMLVAGRNVIEIRFADTIDYITKKQEGRRLWHTYWEKPEYATQGFNRIRKSHCSYGWDWGPIVPDIGIWRDLRILRYEGGRLGTPLVRQEHADGTVRLELGVPVETWNAPGLDVEFELFSPDGKCITTSKGETVAAVPGELPVSRTIFSIKEPRLWWPAGLGEQSLYRIAARLKDSDGNTLDKKELEIGLRTMDVRREKDEWGESFAFEVNGLPFFARGGDWIPEDVYLTRPTRADTERLISDAAVANYNCIRVWGGGIYPSDDFFSLCDRYGLVVWQDLMFACALYDADDPDFMEEIQAEAYDNLERIRHHASLGLVCGNNEMEWAFVEWTMNQTNKHRTEYLKQYQFVLPEVVKKAAPEVYYWPASPSSGGDFEKPNDPDSGDTHFWAVWHGNKDFKEYEQYYFRFMSEFGFESFPNIKTIESFTLSEDRNVFSPVMEDHQRCEGGNQKIFSYISKYFRFPVDFDSLVYLSQVSQAEAIRHGVEHWRRNRGRCMGAVYWQFNDNWPVASWSSVDYYGRWKALMYESKRAFANVLLSCPVDGCRAELHLSNEGRTATTGTVSWRLTDLSGKTIREASIKADAAPLSSVRVLNLDFSGDVAETETARDRVLFFRYESAEGVSSGGALSFVPPKSISLRKAELRARGTGKDERGKTILEVSSDLPALFVELDCADRDLLFSDNFFHLDGMRSRRITVERGELGPEEAAGKIRVRSLRDSYL